MTVTTPSRWSRRSPCWSSTSRAATSCSAEHLDHPLGRAVPGMQDGDPPAVGQPALDVDDGLLDVAAVGLGGLRRDHPGLDARPGRASTTAGRPSKPRARRTTDGRLDHVVVQPERAERPPRLSLAEGLLADVAELAVGRGAQVDRGDPAAGRCRPGRAEELLAGGHQVVGPAASALGVEHEHVGVGRHQLGEHLHLVDEHRRERLHALHGDAGGDLVGQLDQLRMRLAELGRPAPYVIGEQQLAARRCPQPLDGLQGPLVGDGEGPDLLDVVAPELHPQRVFLGRREDVHDPAADRELAAPLDQVDAGVRRIREASYDVVEVDRVALAQRRPARGLRVP